MSDHEELRNWLANESRLSFDEPRDGLRLSYIPGGDALDCVILRCVICGGPDIETAYLHNLNVLPIADDFKAAAKLHRHRESAGSVRPDEDPGPRAQWVGVEHQGTTYNVTVEEYGHSPRRPDEEPTP
ncbi:hypothetical protein AB0M11_26535 [Streptomyces sp. NPDC051987]|uniref:hypothetical protein n=1 Tax=Streptomyces sp. NPDC051987 TaxID=3155808 RepID=UPI00341D315A